jgi:hypothetical protein
LTQDAPYMDLIAAEGFGLSDSELTTVMRNQDKGIVHIPSWKFPVVDDEYFDLVTTTWMLNEVGESGIPWLISGAARTLKVGGYFYIRDSAVRKARGHQIDYDALLVSIGFEEVARLQVENRKDYHGVPRIYVKTKDTVSPSYDELLKRIEGDWRPNRVHTRT